MLALLGTSLSALDTHGADLDAAYGSPGQIGELLLTKFLLPFELASFLLLVAAVGAVALAGRRGGLDEDDLPVAPRHGLVAPAPEGYGHDGGGRRRLRGHRATPAGRRGRRRACRRPRMPEGGT